MFGQGLNSLRIRFTIMVGVSTATMLLIALLNTGSEPDHHYGMLAGLLTIVVAATGLTYIMTGKLTRPIEKLKASTEAIARGDYEAPVDVDCNCEVGGLADSFRKMVHRLNSNVSRINTLAFEDAVTGLPNRAVLTDILVRNGNQDLALMFIDLDNFKQVNDTLGHEKGDQLLFSAAERIAQEGLLIDKTRLSQCMLGDDSDLPSTNCRVLFRWAGDEFIALIRGRISREEVAEIARRIVEGLAEPFQLEEHSVRVGASIGIAFMNEDATDPTDMIKFADLAMYDAKKSGKSSYAFFDSVMKEAANERAQLEADLHEGIENGQLRVHYQPKVSCDSLSFDAVEALVRWQHPTRGLMVPASFMGIAEACGLLDKIGREVVRIASQDIRQWLSMGIRRRVAINICPSQLLGDQFSSQFLDCLARLDVSPSLIEVELTETSAMADADRTIGHLRALSEAGVQIAIDDFGIGYSNLSYLYSLPFETLKIDKSLISRLDHREDTKIILHSTIQMAHDLGKKVVAEGVETLAEFEVLRTMDCDFIQGYFFSPPVEASRLNDLDFQCRLTKAA